MSIWLITPQKLPPCPTKRVPNQSCTSKPYPLCPSPPIDTYGVVMRANIAALTSRFVSSAEPKRAMSLAVEMPPPAGAPGRRASVGTSIQRSGSARRLHIQSEEHEYQQCAYRWFAG